jgi:hypothetical protein
MKMSRMSSTACTGRPGPMTTARPLYRLDRAERVKEARSHLERVVHVEWHPSRQRDVRRTVTGRLLAVARPLSGAVLDLLVLQLLEAAPEAVSVSLAEVASIVRVGHR